METTITAPPSFHHHALATVVSLALHRQRRVTNTTVLPLHTTQEKRRSETCNHVHNSTIGTTEQQKTHNTISASSPDSSNHCSTPELDLRTPLATINVAGAKPPWSRPFLQKICVGNNHEQAASEIVPPPAALAAPFSHLQKTRKQSVI